MLDGAIEDDPWWMEAIMTKNRTVSQDIDDVAPEEWAARSLHRFRLTHVSS